MLLVTAPLCDIVFEILLESAFLFRLCVYARTIRSVGTFPRALADEGWYFGVMSTDTIQIRIYPGIPERSKAQLL
jgi:hypothetical protein